MKVKIKYDKDESAVPVPRVSVLADAMQMSTEEMLKRLKDSTSSYMMQTWETMYIVTSLWRKGEWVLTLEEGERETREAFVRYLYKKTERHFTVAQINSFIYVYTVYTSFPDEATRKRAAEIIVEEFTGLSKLEIAIPWVYADGSNVIELLKVAADATARDLDEILQARWPRKLKERGVPDQQEIRFGAFKKYLTEDVNFVYDRMLVPRHEEREQHVERAYMAVMKACMERVNVSSDVAFEEMLKLWSREILTAKELEALRSGWALNNSSERKNDDWPFANKALLKKAA